MITRYSFTRKGNKKVGAATTRSTSETCPATCPHKIHGTCYAMQGHERLWWDRLDRGEGVASGDWLWLQDQIKAAKLKPGSLLRHNTAGDLSHINGDILPVPLQALTTIFTLAKLTAYTYTHHKQNEFNLMMVRQATRNGFTVNLSCDTEEQASKRAREGYPATVVVAHDDQRVSWTDEYGCRFQTCPAQLGDVSCDACRLCARSGENRPVVAFRAHGSKKKQWATAVGC